MRTKQIKYAALCVAMAAAVGFTACENNDNDGSTDTKKAPVVYVAGYERNSQGTEVAKLWQNGTPYFITDGGENSEVRTMHVADNGDVYLAGISNGRAILWKNSAAQRLSDSYNSWVTSLCLLGDDVYAVGCDSQALTLWKNGAIQRLNGHQGSVGVAYAACALGSDVYVSGIEIGGSTANLHGVIWKNGEAQAQYSDSTFLYALCAAGGDLYGAGFSLKNGRAALWKNGKVQQLLSDGSKVTYAASVYVSGDDIYVVGNERNADSIYGYTALLWKNGEMQRLSESSGSGANSVYAHGNDVYVAGYERNAQGYSVATLWKNGIPQPLSDGSSHAVAWSVFVK